MTHPYLTRALIASGVVALFAGTSAHAIEIDAFDGPTEIVASETVGMLEDLTVSATPLGGQRLFFVSGGTGALGTFGIIDDGTLQFANSPSSAGTLFVEYDLDAPIDLTDDGASTGFLFTVNFADTPVDFSIVTGSSASGTLPTGITGGGDEVDVFIPFSSFSDPDFDPTAVSFISLSLAATDGAVGADVSISDFRTGVPEPSSLALIALGGLAMMRRRR